VSSGRSQVSRSCFAGLVQLTQTENPEVDDVVVACKKKIDLWFTPADYLYERLSAGRPDPAAFVPYAEKGVVFRSDSALCHPAGARRSTQIRRPVTRSHQRTLSVDRSSLVTRAEVHQNSKGGPVLLRRLKQPPFLIMILDTHHPYLARHYRR
jgi:hypothetical protein